MSPLEQFMVLLIGYAINALIIFAISVGFALFSEKILDSEEEAAITFFTLLGLFPFNVLMDTLEVAMSTSFSFFLRLVFLVIFYILWKSQVTKRKGGAVHYWKTLKAKGREFWGR